MRVCGSGFRFQLSPKLPKLTVKIICYRQRLRKNEANSGKQQLITKMYDETNEVKDSTTCVPCDS